MLVQPSGGRKEEMAKGEREILVEGLKMPLSASVCPRGLLLCLYGRVHSNGRFTCLQKSVQKYISNGYCIRDERYFWCFPPLSNRDLSRPASETPIFSIVLIFIRLYATGRHIKYNEEFFVGNIFCHSHCFLLLLFFSSIVKITILRSLIYWNFYFPPIAIISL